MTTTSDVIHTGPIGTRLQAAEWLTQNDDVPHDVNPELLFDQIFEQTKEEVPS